MGESSLTSSVVQSKEVTLINPLWCQTILKLFSSITFLCCCCCCCQYGYLILWLLLNFFFYFLSINFLSFHLIKWRRQGQTLSFKIFPSFVFFISLSTLHFHLKGNLFQVTSTLTPQTHTELMKNVCHRIVKLPL